MENITIGILAKRADVNKETIRYYERRGLIPKPKRSKSGYRQYSPDTIKHVQFIKRAQALGFSLNEVSELLSLKVSRDTSCSAVKGIAELKVLDIEHKIRSLMKIKKALTKLIATCSGEGTLNECHIIEVLYGKEKLSE